VLTNKGFYLNDQKQEKLPEDNLFSMFYDKNKKTLWVAGSKGLHKSSDKGNSWVDFDKANGLEANEVSSIFVDNLNIYLGTPYGLVHSINGGATWKTYKKQNGLLSNNVFRVIAEKN